MTDKKKMEWTHDWAGYDEAVIAVAAALARSGEDDGAKIAKRAFDVADALAKESLYRRQVRLYDSPLAWIRDQHTLDTNTKRSFPHEVAFLWSMASRGMQLPYTFRKLIDEIREMPDETVASLGHCTHDEAESTRSAVIRLLESTIT